MRGIRRWLAGMAGSSSVAVAALTAGKLGIILAGSIAAFTVVVLAVVVLAGIFGRSTRARGNARKVLCILLGRDPSYWTADEPDDAAA